MYDVKYTTMEYQIYLRVEHELLLEDAGYFVEAFCEDRGLDQDLFDLEELVTMYEQAKDCNVAFNDTWECVVRDYAEDAEII